MQFIVSARYISRWR